MSVDPSPPPTPQYVPALWERILAYGAALSIIVLTAFVIVRNQPFEDRNFAQFLRILLSVAMAIIGAVIPGFLSVDLSGRGWAIRAGGALALVIVTYFFSPKVQTNSSQAEDYPWARKLAALNGDFERLTTPLLPSPTEIERERAVTLRGEELRLLQVAHQEAFDLLRAQKVQVLPSPKQLIRLRYYEAMAHYHCAALAVLRADPDREISKDELAELIDTALREAKECATAAEEGMRWCRHVLTYPSSGEQPIENSPRRWSPDEYRAIRSWVREGIDRDLVWYRTAGHAALAYYGQYEMTKARAEVQELMKLYPTWSKDPPQKDSLMRRILEDDSLVEQARGKCITIKIDMESPDPSFCGYNYTDSSIDSLEKFSAEKFVHLGMMTDADLVAVYRKMPKVLVPQGPCCR